MRGWRYAILRRLLAVADLAAALLASLSLAVVADGDVGRLAWSLPYLPVWVVLAKLLGLYDRDQRSLRHLTVDEAPQLVLWAVIGTLGLSLFLGFTPAGRPSAASVIAAVVVAALAGVLLRSLVRFVWRTVMPPERVALIGTSATQDAIRRKLELFPDLHMTIVEEHGSLESDGNGNGASDWLGTVDRVVYGPPALDDVEIGHMLDRARAAGVMVSVVPPCRRAFGPSVRLHHLAELPLLEYRTSDLSRSTVFLKRTADVIASAPLLALLSPLFLVIAVAIKLDSRGPVFFSQWRAGQDGKPFRMHKFRTMVENAEDLLPQIVRLDELSEPVFKLRRDPRVTRVGRRLRRWSLDELPQLVNVLRGSMSLVGPRPEQIEVVDLYSADQRFRLTVKPGLTGPMQVSGRGALGLEERLAVEQDYIENLSLGRDVRILAMTATAVFRGKGAF